MRYWTVCLVGGLVSWGSTALAQSIVPEDGTRVEQVGVEHTITGGHRSADGLNLFHGFERFSLDGSEGASFVVSGDVANVIGRISGGEASVINGQLQLLGSNADLFLLNPAGIIFGEGATLALPSNFLATTADGLLFDGGTFPALGSVDYAALVGEPIGLEFLVAAGGGLINSGDLTVSPNASLSLIGSSVVNSGSLLSSGGSITLAAVPESHYVRLNTAGSVLGYDFVPQLLTSEFTPLDLPELLTESSVASATGLVVNADGSLQIAGAGIGVTPGTVLSAGTVDVSGAGAGEVQLLGEQVGLLAGQVMALGDQVGGNIWIGGSQEGKGPLPNARAIYVAPVVEVRADGQGRGSGGNIIFWSEESSRIDGVISARGGVQGGDGGFVETSSRGFLAVTQAPDVSGTQGEAGLWLLDPFDIEIQENLGNNVNLPVGNPFTATGPVAILDISVLNAALANGSVVVSTTTNGGTANGDITLVDPLVYTAGAGASLELSAAGDINIDASISSKAGSAPLNLSLLADVDGQGNGVVEIASGVLVDTAGGSLIIQGNGETSLAAGVALLDSSTLQTGGGSVTITGRSGSSEGVLVEAFTSIDTLGTNGTASIVINGVSQTGIGIDLGGVQTTSSLLTLNGRTGSTAVPAVRSTFRLFDESVGIDAVGAVELESLEAGTNIDITTDRFLRVTGTNTSGQSLVAPMGIRISHGGDGQTPFVVGDATVNGTAGAIATDNATISPIRTFSETFSQGNISLLTAAANLPDCVEDCNDLGDDNLGDDDFGDGDVGDDDILSDSFDDDSLDFEDGEETDGLEDGDDDFDDDDAEYDDDDDDFDDDEYEYDFDDDISYEILDDAEITSEELAVKDKTQSEEYSQYLGVQSEQTLPLPEVQEKLSQVALETGSAAGIIYIDFVPTNQAQPKQVLDNELNQDNHVLELVLVTADGTPQRRRLDITKANAQKTVAQFQRGVINRSFGNRYLRPAQRLHSWMISPLESLLKDANISHLSFVLPSGLRALPVAALHDGDTFLIERYSVGIMPSVGLTNIEYNDVRSAQVLAVGASSFVDQPALPAVPLELKTIADTLWPGRFFLNELFTPERILANRQRGDFSILHLATHGEFRPGDPSHSYIQFWDRRLTLDQLSTLSLNEPPLDLLVLSACRTALGSREAELGFAGLAVQAGVKTALASLWRVDDVGTAGLMTEFYSHLRYSSTRTDALRQAQLAMMQGNVTVEAGQLNWTEGSVSLPSAIANEQRDTLGHPFYWAAFTLIGSPW